MIREAIGVADTIDEARKMATDSLNAPLEADVKVEIVSMPKKKVLGLFGGSPAKVRAFYEDGKAAPVPAAPKAPAQKPAPASKAPGSEKKAPAQEKKAPSPEKKAPSAEKKAAPAKEQTQQKPRQDKKPRENKAPKKEVVREPIVEVDLSGVEAKETPATEYLKSILVGMGFQDAGVTVKETAEDLYFEITCGDDYGNIIGRRGETLDALQYLTRLFVNRSDSDSKRVALNVGDYRARRAETLKGLARRQASRVIKYGRNAVLEPMNPYERRIIHTAVQEIEGVTSHSVGEGEGRRVVIAPEGGERRTGNFDRESKGNFERKGGYDRGRRDGGREKRPPYVPEKPAEDRAPKEDATVSARYGKIEPKHPAAAPAVPAAPVQEKPAPAREDSVAARAPKNEAASSVRYGKIEPKHPPVSAPVAPAAPASEPASTEEPAADDAE